MSILSWINILTSKAQTIVKKLAFSENNICIVEQANIGDKQDI